MRRTKQFLNVLIALSAMHVWGISRILFQSWGFLPLLGSCNVFMYYCKHRSYRWFFFFCHVCLEQTWRGSIPAVGTSCVKFTCSPRACEGSLWVLQSKNMHVRGKLWIDRRCACENKLLFVFRRCPSMYCRLVEGVTLPAALWPLEWGLQQTPTARVLKMEGCKTFMEWEKNNPKNI